MLALADLAVPVTNALDTARWWHQKLGFSIHTVGPPGGHAIMIAPPGERFLIHLCEGFEAVDPGNTGIAFMTDEIDQVVARMEAGGVQFTEPLKKEEWGAMAKFADPDGNVFWLLGAPRPFIEQELARRGDREPSAPVSPKKSTAPRGKRKPSGPH